MLGAYGAKMPRTSWEHMASFGFPAANLGEQWRIADFLDERVALIDQIIAARRAELEVAASGRLSRVAEDLSEIPAGAPLRRFLAAVQTGGTPGPDADDPEGLDWYSPGSFTSDLRVVSAPRHVQRGACPMFPRGSVLLVGIGATAGKVAWLPADATGNQQLTALTPSPGILDGRFLLHVLDARRAQLLAGAPSATLPILNNETIRALKVPVPPFREQVALAQRWDAVLDRAHGLGEAVSLLTAKLGEYKQSLITAAVTGQLDVTTASTRIPENLA